MKTCINRGQDMLIPDRAHAVRSIIAKTIIDGVENSSATMRLF
jgi:hypothetical protein